MKKCLWALFFVIGTSMLTAACAHKPAIDSVKAPLPGGSQQRREMLIGSWYAELPTKDGLLRKSLMQRRRDGTYTIKFQLFQGDKKVSEQVEAGLWGVSGHAYFTMTREMLYKNDFRAIDTTDASFYDAYRIIELKPDFFRYVSFEFNDEFSAKKVSDKLTLP